VPASSTNARLSASEPSKCTPPTTTYPAPAGPPFGMAAPSHQMWTLIPVRSIVGDQAAAGVMTSHGYTQERGHPGQASDDLSTRSAHASRSPILGFAQALAERKPHARNKDDVAGIGGVFRRERVEESGGFQLSEHRA
jgi:hypothetical protein